MNKTYKVEFQKRKLEQWWQEADMMVEGVVLE